MYDTCLATNGSSGFLNWRKAFCSAIFCSFSFASSRAEAATKLSSSTASETWRRNVSLYDHNWQLIGQRVDLGGFGREVRIKAFIAFRVSGGWAIRNEQGILHLTHIHISTKPLAESLKIEEFWIDQVPIPVIQVLSIFFRLARGLMLRFCGRERLTRLSVERGTRLRWGRLKTEPARTNAGARPVVACFDPIALWSYVWWLWSLKVHRLSLCPKNVNPDT